MLTKADLEDVMASVLHRSEEGLIGVSSAVDEILDAIIAKTESSRTIDEMLRVKEGRE